MHLFSPQHFPRIPILHTSILCIFNATICLPQHVGSPCPWMHLIVYRRGFIKYFICTFSYPLCYKSLLTYILPFCPALSFIIVLPLFILTYLTLIACCVWCPWSTLNNRSCALWISWPMDANFVTIITSAFLTKFAFHFKLKYLIHLHVILWMLVHCYYLSPYQKSRPASLIVFSVTIPLLWLSWSPVVLFWRNERRRGEKTLCGKDSKNCFPNELWLLIRCLEAIYL